MFSRHEKQQEELWKSPAMTHLELQRLLILEQHRHKAASTTWPGDRGLLLGQIPNTEAYIILAITYLPEDKDPICKIYGIKVPALQSFNSAHGCNSSNNDTWQLCKSGFSCQDKHWERKARLCLSLQLELALLVFACAGGMHFEAKGICLEHKIGLKYLL